MMLYWKTLFCLLLQPSILGIVSSQEVVIGVRPSVGEDGGEVVEVEPTTLSEVSEPQTEPVAVEAVVPVVEEEPAAVEEEVVAVEEVEEEAVPVVEEEAAPVVEEEAAPIVEEEAAPVVEEEAAPVVEEEAAPVVEEEPTAPTTSAALPLATLILELAKDGTGLVQDLGLGTYLEGNLIPLIPGLESITLVPEYEKGSYAVTYKGTATFSDLMVDMNLIAAFLTKDTNTTTTEAAIAVKGLFAAKDEEEEEEEAAGGGGLFATKDEEEESAVEETAAPTMDPIQPLTTKVLHELQIAVLSDVKAIEEYWVMNAETIGTNLKIESMEFTDVQTEEAEPEVLVDEVTEETKEEPSGLSQKEKDMVLIIVLVCSFFILLVAGFIMQKCFN